MSLSEIRPLFAYFDETGFDDARAFGYGMLLTESPVQPSLIERALADLKSDPDFDRKYDRVTVGRGFFHASEDSKNAHSHLCRQIVESVDGEFFYATTRNDRVSKLIRYTEPPTSEDHFDMMLTDNFIRTITRARQVEIIIEGRSTLSEQRVRWLFERIVWRLERRVVDMTMIPFYAPNVVFRTVGKSEPGIQVVDFILWALNRRHANKKCPWMGRLGLTFKSDSGAEESPEKSEEFSIGKALSYERMLYPEGAFPLPEIGELIGAGAERIRETLLGLSNSRLPSHVSHLADQLREFAPKLSQPATVDAVQCAASLFLRLFDTLPLYRDVPKDNVAGWKNLLLLRKIASALLGGVGPEEPIADPPKILITMSVEWPTNADKDGKK